MTATIEDEGEQYVLWEDMDGVRIVTLNRPERLNAINMEMLRQLEEVILLAQQSDDIRVLLLRGAGRAFCAGDDVNEQAKICEAGEASLQKQLRHLQNISTLLTLGDKITVVEVRGWAVGAGFSWVLNCDFRVWSAEARAYFPEVGFGTFVTGGATFLLPRLIGQQAAVDLLFLGAKLDPSHARAACLIHSVHSEGELMGAAAKLARELAGLPAPSLRGMKRALANRIASEFCAALDEEVGACIATTLDPRTLERLHRAIVRN